MLYNVRNTTNVMVHQLEKCTKHVLLNQGEIRFRVTFELSLLIENWYHFIYFILCSPILPSEMDCTVSKEFIMNTFALITNNQFITKDILE